MNDSPYHTLVQHYTSCFEQHGATPKGVDWPKDEDVATRYRVMLGLLRPEDTEGASLLDLGCGYGGLLDYLKEQRKTVRYRGIDLSEPMIHAAKARHPGVPFELRDIIRQPLAEQSVDYITMNGVLTEKRELSFEQMEQFAHALISAAFAAARKGVAFNVMSAQVDWQRDDLFHLPFDRLAEFLTKHVSRHFAFRADYGLYEYTAYVYR